MNTEQMRARWYSVDATGMATLCRDEADARKTAADNSIMWPNLAPHKAVQLIEARAAITHPPKPACVGGVPDIDYEALINAAFAADKRWAQGTYGCIAFARGAEWYRDQVLTAAPQAPADAPVWVEGRPANLAAAAKDADEWLALIQRLNDAGRWKFSEPDSRSRLDGCRAAIAAMSTKAGGV